MKTFTTAEIRDLYGRVTMGEISFTRMVEVINERVEAVSDPKFKIGDKVMLKSGCKNASRLSYFSEMDEWIGKPITVSEFDQSDFVYDFSDCSYYLHEDWLEPYVEKMKKGDLAIFWDDDKEFAILRFYEKSSESEGYFRHIEKNGSNWKNAIKFESIEQYERLIRGEI